MPVCSSDLNLDEVSLLLRLLLRLGHLLFDGLDALDHAFHHLLFFLGALLDRLFGCLIVELALYGFQPWLDWFNAMPAFREALIGGSVDVAGIHYLQTIQMAAEGQRLRTFFLMTHRGGFVLAVAPAASATN